MRISDWSSDVCSSDLTSAAGIRLFDFDAGQGIVHVMAPELGLILPGFTIACGDSHTCTNGGMGALTFGIGTSECVHVLATTPLRQRRPKMMTFTLDGTMARGVTTKEVRSERRSVGTECASTLRYG